MRVLLAATLLIAVACAQPSTSAARTPPASAAASSAPTPSLTPTPTLFAALEAKGTNLFRPNTVVIAGLDGVTRAKATFTPVVPPPVACLGTWLPTAAYVAAGKVFFADGKGVIRSLSVDGQVLEVATFPTSSRQMLSFAVSPDGATLLATVFTVPPLTPGGLRCSPTGRHYSSDFTLEVFSAHPGAAPQLLYRQLQPEVAQRDPCIVDLVGWDQVGPYAAAPACLGPGGGPVRYYGTVVRVSPLTGKVTEALVNPLSCRVEDVALTGDFVCNPVTPSTSCCGTGDISVRQSDGREMWHFAATAGGGFDYDFLSPDEQHVLAGGWDANVLGRDGSDVQLDSTSFFEGWLDSSTVIGSFNGGNLAYVSLSAPTKTIDLGFAGAFVGTVSA